MQIKYKSKYDSNIVKPQYLDCEKDMLTADELAAVINALCAGGGVVVGIVRDKDAY